ncbi:MAG: hypothetical protein HY879_26930 [Deltaproteobacteria bacterium]|nr:hypothetical protein [Deltaproteobacteria bacterium]
MIDTIIYQGLFVIITFGILVVGTEEARAMRTRDAILLGGAIAIFAPPILRAIGEICNPPVYQPAPVIYAPAPASPANIPRTAYERGVYDEQLRIERELERYEYLSGRQDARRYYYYEE